MKQPSTKIILLSIIKEINLNSTSRARYLLALINQIITNSMHVKDTAMIGTNVSVGSPVKDILCLTFWRRNYFFNFSTSCI